MPVQCLCHASKWLGRKRSKCIQVVALLKQCGICMALHVSWAEDMMVYPSKASYRVFFSLYIVVMLMAKAHCETGIKVCILWNLCHLWPIQEPWSWQHRGLKTFKQSVSISKSALTGSLCAPTVPYKNRPLLLKKKKKKDASLVNCLPPNESRLDETLPWHKI